MKLSFSSSAIKYLGSSLDRSNFKGVVSEKSMGCCLNWEPLKHSAYSWSQEFRFSAKKFCLRVSPRMNRVYSTRKNLRTPCECKNSVPSSVSCMARVRRGDAL
jgi:hypothetical protein